MARRISKKVEERDPWLVFLSELGRHGSTRKALKIAGLSRTMLRERLREDDDFHILVADAEDDSADRLEETAVTFAKMGDVQLIKYMLDAKRYKRTSETTIVPPSINITIGTKKKDKSE